MKAAYRIALREAHEKVKAGQALLVCADEEPERFQALQLEGAISLQEFRSHGASMSWDQEIIFYCASPDGEAAAGQAAKGLALGFSNSKVLLGGVKGWKEAGYRLVSHQPFWSVGRWVSSVWRLPDEAIFLELSV
jgi:rhodanese-related sulfurtransferase